MTAMRVLSVNVSMPREASWRGTTVTTGIFKEPVESRIAVRTLNLAGDGQADLSVHGGPEKAIYVYPSEHYAFWRDELPEMELPWGMFGENLTVEGVFEDAIHIGDRFRVGSAEVRVTQPRFPCYKMRIKFGREDIIQRFLESGRSGFYLAVVEEGDVGAGDRFDRLERDSREISVADFVAAYTTHRDDLALMRRMLELPALPYDWKSWFRRRIEKLERS
jgi:MOSC domain-containing protein YiiM